MLDKNLIDKDEYDLSDRLRTRGWQVPAYSMPANRQDMVVMHILVRHGFSRDMAGLLIGDFKRAMDHFAAHPVSIPLNGVRAAGSAIPAA